MGSEKLLDVKDLTISFHTFVGEVAAVRNVDFYLKKSEVLAIVGESGSGKSVSTQAILGLTPIPPGEIKSGKILFKRKDLLKFNENEMSKICGSRISMIFQDPMTSLNPTMKIGNQIREVLHQHTDISRRESRERAIELMTLVRIPEPEMRINQYPHELSGGMRQRVMITIAMANRPDILIADEPTTALDVTVQAQIIELMKDMQRKTNAAIWLITHDLGVIAETCDKVGVMYAGYIVEFGDVRSIFNWPNHPYTKGLLKTIPKITKKREKLDVIPGLVPNLITPPSGCRFHPRCKYATDECKKNPPPLVEVEKNHFVACHHHEDVKLSVISKYQQVKS